MFNLEKSVLVTGKDLNPTSKEKSSNVWIIKFELTSHYFEQVYKTTGKRIISLPDFFDSDLRYFCAKNIICKNTCQW